jgi:hypothetical protein
MNHSARSVRWVPVLAIVALSFVALATATFGGHVPEAPAVAAQRPAADAPVDVVRLPASTTAPRQRCRTCELGAARGWL